MTDVVTLERIMPASVARVFEMISQPKNMVSWWGNAKLKSGFISDKGGL